MEVADVPEIEAAQLKRLLDRARADLERPLAVFDADGTLWSGDLGLDLFTAAIARRALRGDAVPALRAEARALGLAEEGDANALAERLLDAFSEGLYDDARAFGMMAWAFAGFSVDEMDDFAQDVVRREEVEARVLSPVRSMVSWAQGAGVEVVVCSPAPVSVIVAAARLFGVEAPQVVAATPEVVAGSLVPRLRQGPLPFAEGKVAALSRDRSGRPLLAAFGDSVSDAALMRRARVPVAVGPTARLLEQASTIPGLVVLRT